MSRPPLFAPRPLPKPGVFRRVPPMVFPPLLGALILGLGWREAVGLFGMSAGMAEGLLGALALLWVFAQAAYLAKLVRRAGVLAEDLAILPGRVGLGAAVMSDYAAAMVIAPYLPGLARGVLCAGLLLHVVMMIVAIRGMLAGPAEGRDVTPAWQMLFAGPMLAAVAALALGWPDLARGLLLVAAPVSVVIWALSLRQLALRIPPAPLRPLLLLHPAMAAVLGLGALGLGWSSVALAAAGLALILLIGCSAALRWIAGTGFTAFWGVAGFPLSTFVLLALGLPGAAMAGGVMLVPATLVTLPLLARVLQDWARGRLAAGTNAAEA